MVLAVICGGLIGIEREYKRRPAGFRTHILICLGAAMTTLTSQYLYLNQGLFTDISRLGAQVIAGIGFIGAGTIIVTKHQRVKGLTTAAGLWTAAIIGLVCGAGYVECALFATIMVLVAELLLIRIEYRFAQKTQDLNLYIEYSEAKAIEDIARLLREKHLTMKELEISRVNKSDNEMTSCAIIGVRFNKKQFDDGLAKAIATIQNVTTVEEL
jgi:putative Mg2+ transporter-C (MgtC) family protein